MIVKKSTKSYVICGFARMSYVKFNTLQHYALNRFIKITYYGVYKLKKVAK